MVRRLLFLAPLLVLLVGCDQLGIESASVTAARQDADGKAVGAACRHAGRAIEDCFTLNRRVDKASIYAGWREMDDYMRENKMEAVPPVLAAAVAKRAEGDGAAADDAAAKTAHADKGDAKAEPKAGARPDKSARADDAGKGAKVAARDGGPETDDKAAASH